MIAVCRTEGCPENGVEKPGEIALAPGEDVYCGECCWPCEVTDLAPAPPPEPVEWPAYRRVPPPPEPYPWPILTPPLQGPLESEPATPTDA